MSVDTMLSLESYMSSDEEGQANFDFGDSDSDEALDGTPVGRAMNASL